MSDPPVSGDPDAPRWSREGIPIGLSLIGAGASLNSWFPAFQVLGVILILAGVVVLATAFWPFARAFARHHLQTRSRRFAAGAAAIAILAVAALAGFQLVVRQHLTSIDAPSRAETSPTLSLLDLLPGEDEIPVDLVEKETNKRTGEALAELFSSRADELRQRLLEWDFVENAYRTFGRAAGATPTPDTLYFLEVSIHRFGNPTGASRALSWFASDRSQLAGLATKPIEQIGDETQAIAGEQEDPNGATAYREATVYARHGTVVVRVTARSKRANPMPVAVAVIRLVVAKIPI